MNRNKVIDALAKWSAYNSGRIVTEHFDVEWAQRNIDSILEEHRKGTYRNHTNPLVRDVAVRIDEALLAPSIKRNLPEWF